MTVCAPIIAKIYSGRFASSPSTRPSRTQSSPHEILNANPYAFLDDAPLEERRSRAVQMRRILPEAVLNEVGPPRSASYRSACATKRVPTFATATNCTTCCKRWSPSRKKSAPTTTGNRLSRRGSRTSPSCWRDGVRGAARRSQQMLVLSSRPRTAVRVEGPAVQPHRW